MRSHAKIWHNVAGPACDVFINHRTVDTRRSVVRLLYNHLTQQGCNPFLDAENLRPGDRLLDTIDKSIRGCNVGVAVFSPRYCDSYYCLHELSLIMESKKRIVPIFYDVKPSQLRIVDSSILMSCSQKDLRRFDFAIEEAKCIVGLPFDSSKEDWSELLRNASDAVVMNLFEVETETAIQHDAYV
ncbi:hypothetical protein K1719_008534 [Acacia pycnantha]|nr:hypothetical protein K1719_008534 [Acacia pycnantha]